MKGDRLEQCHHCGLFAHIVLRSETMGDFCQECLDEMAENDPDCD